MTTEIYMLSQEASSAVDALLADAVLSVRRRVTTDGRVISKLLDREQRAAHGLSWFATYEGSRAGACISRTDELTSKPVSCKTELGLGP